MRAIDLLAPIMKGCMALAKQKGCDCVEPDNMDSYTNLDEVNPSGSYTAAHQRTYNEAIAQWAHDEGLSVALKNDIDQLDDLVDDFDWALNEQCYQYNECDGYQTFVDAGKAVFGVEYNADTSSFCSDAYESGYSWLKKKLALDAWVEACPVQDTVTASTRIPPSLPTRSRMPAAKLTGVLFDITGREVKGPRPGRGVYLVATPDGRVAKKPLTASTVPAN